MSQYTNTQVGAIQNFKCVAYYNSIFLGVFEEGDTKVTFTPEYEKVGSALTGTAPVKKFLKGVSECSATFMVRSYNKHVLKTVYEDIINAVSGGTATDNGSPFTGAVEGVADPKILAEKALVIYPLFTDEAGIFGAAGTSYSDNTSNPLAHLIPLASIFSGLDLIYSPTSVTSFELKFEGSVDVANGNRMIIQDDGIDTDGTYTP